MEKQKERARKARNDAASMGQQRQDLLNFHTPSSFVYEDVNIESKVIGLFVDGQAVAEVSGEGEIVFETTNFYAESGGQVGDQGRLYNPKTEAEVTNVYKAPNKQHLHLVNVLYGTIKLGDRFTMQIDHQRRHETMRNHSATHLLHSVLVDVLGDHITQQGSFVSDEYLRFDFSHYEKISGEQLLLIEKKVNKLIASSLTANIRELPIKEAEKLGAKAFFSEKYGAKVRVVNFGEVSSEFCGGTHVANTEEIGLFVIESEESIAAGIRRIQARTSFAGYELLKKREHILDQVQNLFGTNSYSEIIDRGNALLNEIRDLKKDNLSLVEKVTSIIASSLSDHFVLFNGYKVLLKHLPSTSRDILTKVGDNLKSYHPDHIIVLAGGSEGDIPLVAFVGGLALKDGLRAGDLIKELTKHVAGSGGGRPEMAQGQGRNVAMLEKAFASIKELIK
jgi:alanyl-tRNA synthetase